MLSFTILQFQQTRLLLTLIFNDAIYKRVLVKLMPSFETPLLPNVVYVVVKNSRGENSDNFVVSFAGGYQLYLYLFDCGH